MLIGESGDGQSVCFRTMDDTRPIDRHCDISLSDLFEWRTQTSMLCADLNVSLNPLAEPAVIDRNDIPPLQVCRDLIDPGERSLARLPVSIDRALDEDKVVAVETYKFFPAVSEQAHRHRIEQFVGKMDTCEWLKRLTPFNFPAK